MRYMTIGFSFIFGVSFLFFGIMNGFALALEGNYNLAIRASWINFLIGIFLTIAGYTMYKNTNDNSNEKEHIDSIDKQNVEPITKIKKYIWYIISGFWLSIPTVGFSIYIILADIQHLVLLSLLPVIIGLPWSIPAALIMLGAGLGHGGSEAIKMFFFLLSAFWIFITVSINGANIYLLVKNEKKKEQPEIENVKSERVKKIYQIPSLYIITSIIVIITLISFFIIRSKQVKEGRLIHHHLINCGEDEIVTRKASSTKLYLGNKVMGGIHQANYFYLGELKDNKVTLIASNNNLFTRGIKCIESTPKYDLVVPNKYFKDSVLSFK
ncbi:hypothetical protein [Candidatus Sulfurimonas baltica]|uniref:Uncharacterized protein n=1 Tax=Candidatus Sulfurimonas baltica TaxID=2740404 RepID=A0A7S7LXC4_9BACT|nr:hypothetical protein [Candidatus Sulfurimonas baltica]QOY52608.1 hypothetical protein HUE88_02655 [Candidatus Sulfurimonas baltica]